MKIVCILLSLLLPAIAAADASLFMSFMRNSSNSGNQVCVTVLQGGNAGPVTCKFLPSAGGLSHLMKAQNSNEVYVFYNMRNTSSGPIKIFRDTVTVQPFQFVPNSTRTFFNVNGFLNFDVNNQISTSQRVANRVDSRSLNDSGIFTGPFKRLPEVPGVPFSSSIFKNQQGDYFSTMWIQNGSAGPTGITFRHIQSNTVQNYAFTGPKTPISHDSFSVDNEIFIIVNREVTQGTPDKVSTVFRAFDYEFNAQGNVITVDPPRPDPNPSSFNTACGTLFDPTDNQNDEQIAVAFNRYDANVHAYDYYFKRYERRGFKPIGSSKRIVDNPPNTVSYGCSLLGWDPEITLPNQ
jgi:hypothetical protein